MKEFFIYLFSSLQLIFIDTKKREISFIYFFFFKEKLHFDNLRLMNEMQFIHSLLCYFNFHKFQLNRFNTVTIINPFLPLSLSNDNYYFATGNENKLAKIYIFSRQRMKNNWASYGETMFFSPPLVLCCVWKNVAQHGNSLL